MLSFIDSSAMPPPVPLPVVMAEQLPPDLAEPHGDRLAEGDGNHLLLLVEELFTWGAVCAIVLGGVVPYIPQYRKIRKTRDAEGFSTFVCLVLLIANILRILFWFGKHYELPLLAQSVIMTACMMAMMELCTRVKTEKGSHVTRRLTDLDHEYFWKWTDYKDYCLFVALFSLVGGAVTFLLVRVSLYVELLGFASLFLEAMLGVPQFWQNLLNKSTEGMSVQMVLLWLSGDLFKTGYFIVREAPFQFWMCGSLQVMVDVLILLQVALYRDSGRSRSQLQLKGKTTN